MPEPLKPGDRVRLVRSGSTHPDYDPRSKLRESAPLSGEFFAGVRSVRATYEDKDGNLICVVDGVAIPAHQLERA